MILSFSIAQIIYLTNIKEVTDSNLDLLNSQSAADCSDEWSKVDLRSVIEQHDYSNSKIISGYIYLGVVIFYVLVELIILFFTRNFTHG